MAPVVVNVDLIRGYDFSLTVGLADTYEAPERIRRGFTDSAYRDRASKFYERFGFVTSPVREKQLVLLLKDARKLIRLISEHENKIDIQNVYLYNYKITLIVYCVFI